MQVPQPRGDLESLMRLGIDQFSAALGVPSSLLFEGRFSNNSTASLQLLNSTISQLAKAVSAVLTKTYNMLYADDEGSGEEPAQLKLVTSPLAVGAEIQGMFTAQLIDYETALPAAMHALGATSAEIEAALERAQAKEERLMERETEDRAAQKQNHELEVREREHMMKMNGDKGEKGEKGEKARPDADQAQAPREAE